MAMLRRDFARLPIPRAPVLVGVSEAVEVAVLGGVGARPSVPRVSLVVQGGQSLQVAAPRGHGRHLFVLFWYCRQQYQHPR